MDTNSENQAFSTTTVQPMIFDMSPSEFRYLQNVDGSLKLQGGYRYTTMHETGIEWRDIPVVTE